MSGDPRDRSVIEASSWTLASELVRRHPESTRIVHTRPGGGQYDCLTITSPRGDGQFVQLNRTGTIQVHHRFDGEPADEWEPTGWDEYLQADPHSFLERLEQAAGLTPPSQVPPASPMTLTYCVLAALAATVVKSEQLIEIEPGHFDTSGYGGGANRALDLFLAVPASLRQAKPDDLFGEPGYRFWVVLQDQVPILAFEQDQGFAWTLHHDETIELMDLYDQARNDLDVTTRELLRLVVGLPGDANWLLGSTTTDGPTTSPVVEPPISRPIPPDSLGIDDLIDALGNHLRWKSAHPDLRDYWSRRYQCLRLAFGLEPDPLDERAESGPRTAGVASLLASAALGAQTSPSPFGGFLEGSDGVIEIYQQFSLELEGLAHQQQDLHHAIAKSCLRILVPGIEAKRCPIADLKAAGLDEMRPDPLDYL